jgi:hypothetical protein
MKIKLGSFFLIFILLLSIFAAGISIGFGYLDALLAPLLISIMIFILAAIELRRELLSEEKRPQDIAERWKGRTELHRFGMALGWMGGFALGIYILGFFLSIPVFAFTYVKLRGRGWLQACVFAVCLTLILYLIFEMGLRSQLYRGLLFGA